MLKLKLVLVLCFTSLIFFWGCRHKNDPLWNEVVNYFTDPARTTQEIFSRLSPIAMQSIYRQPVPDTTEPIIELFRSLKDNHNYTVDNKGDTVFISFNPKAEIAGGPYFDIVKRDATWKIVDIRFGK